MWFVNYVDVSHRNLTVTDLHLLVKPEDMTRSQFTLSTHIFTATKQVIAKEWLTYYLLIVMVKTKVDWTMSIEKLTSRMLDKMPQHLAAMDLQGPPPKL